METSFVSVHVVFLMPVSGFFHDMPSDSQLVCTIALISFLIPSKVRHAQRTTKKERKKKGKKNNPLHGFRDYC